MKVCELIGALLDYWVGRAQGEAVKVKRRADLDYSHFMFEHTEDLVCVLPGETVFLPSSVWAIGGPIIERDQIFLQPPSEVHYNGGPNHGWRRYDHWRATVSARTRTLPPKNETQDAISIRGVGRGAGETPLLAAMRAKVASHYGDEVPDEVAK